MAHDFLKPEVLARAAIGLANTELILAKTVWRDAETYFNGSVGPNGDTIQIGLPGVTNAARELAWRSASREIVTDDIVERKVDVKLDTYLYKSIDLLREEQTLDIEDFGVQVLSPMTTSVAEGAEAKLASIIKGAPYEETIQAGTGDRAIYNALVDASKFLNANRVPRQGRVAIIGSAMEARALKDPTLVDVDRSGSDSALREAQIGKIAGYTLIASDAIDPDAIYVYHPTAFPTVFRAPKPARSVPFSQSVQADSVSLTYWESLNPKVDSDRAFLGTFFGGTVLKDPKDATKPTTNLKFVRGVKIAAPAEDGTGGEGVGE